MIFCVSVVSVVTFFITDFIYLSLFYLLQYSCLDNSMNRGASFLASLHKVLLVYLLFILFIIH